MRRITLDLFLGVLALIAAPVATSIMARPAPSPQLTGDTLDQKEKTFIGYTKDFLDMAKSYQTANAAEFQIAMDLHDIADRESERIDNADTLLLVYGGTSCQTDRTTFRSLVAHQLSSASKYTNLEIQSAQNDLTYTGMPGVAALAVRMKDDLRDAASALGQAGNSLE